MTFCDFVSGGWGTLLGVGLPERLQVVPCFACDVYLQQVQWRLVAQAVYGSHAICACSAACCCCCCCCTTPQARLEALELPQLAADLAATAAAAAASRRKSSQAPQRGISSKRSRAAAEALPLRQSARKRGQAPDPTLAGGIDYEARDGRVVLAAFIPERYGAAGSVIPLGDDSAAAAAALKRPPPGPLQFKSSNGDEATDAAFLQQLRGYAAAQAGSSAGAAIDGDSTQHLGAERLMQLRLASVDVAKLTTQGVSCMAFHPNSGSKPIIAAADKSGKVRTDSQRAGEEIGVVYASMCSVICEKGRARGAG